MYCEKVIPPKTRMHFKRPNFSSSFFRGNFALLLPVDMYVLCCWKSLIWTNRFFMVYELDFGLTQNTKTHTRSVLFTKKNCIEFVGALWMRVRFCRFPHWHLPRLCCQWHTSTMQAQIISVSFDSCDWYCCADVCVCVSYLSVCQNDIFKVNHQSTNGIRVFSSRTSKRKR